MVSPWWLGIAAAGAILGCGDNFHGDPSDARSGSRLKVMRYVYEDGTRQWERNRFHDAERDEPCSPARWSDGHMYCTPEAATTVFANAACTLEVGRVVDGAPAPSYFLGEFWVMNAFFPSRLFGMGTRTSAPAELFRKRDGSCEPIERGLLDEYYMLGAGIPRSELVRIKRIEPSSEARLGIALHASDDGLEIPIAIHDHLLEVDCVVDERFNDVATTCLPSEYVDADYFHDARCTEPEISVQTPTGIPSIARVHAMASGCTTFHAVGVETDATSLYVQPGATCIASNPPPGDHQFLVSAQLTLATMSREPIIVPGRRLNEIRLGGSLRSIDRLLVDTQTGADCRRTIVGDTLRCLPETSSRTQVLFGDASCSSIVVVAAVHVRGCDLGSPFAVQVGDTGEIAIHPLVGPFATPLYKLTTGDRCVVAVPPPELVMYEIGPALPLASFPAAIAVVDP